MSFCEENSAESQGLSCQGRSKELKMRVSWVCSCPPRKPFRRERRSEKMRGKTRKGDPYQTAVQEGFPMNRGLKRKLAKPSNSPFLWSKRASQRIGD